MGPLDLWLNGWERRSLCLLGGKGRGRGGRESGLADMTIGLCMRICGVSIERTFLERVIPRSCELC